MKKILFLLTGIMIYSLTTFGQQVALTDAISIDIPKEGQKINRNEVISHSQKTFNSDKIILKKYTDNYTEHTYKFGDILVSLFPFDTIKTKQTLEDLKKGVDELFNHPNMIYTSSIKKINNNSILITHYTLFKTEQYQFYCYNENNTRGVNGRLEFLKADEDKAKSILDHLLNSIKFKN